MTPTPRGLPLEDVVNLPNYGKSFPFIPWTLRSKLRVSLVFARTLLHDLGWTRFLVFWMALPFRLGPTYRSHGEGFRLMRAKFGLMAEAEWILLVIIYRYLDKTRGKDDAYAFAKRAIQRSSEFMMNDFYQADRLADFSDPFEAFWSYHKAMFMDDPNYPNEFVEQPDVRTMIVHGCRNCQIAEMTIPELATLGCDHDLTGYKAIEEKTHMEFRRPQTLAKDGQPCRFTFYRRGTAPKGAYENH
jgi:L-2-amino-thiazoline-4-carboxylic acid hydrolase